MPLSKATLNRVIHELDPWFYPVKIKGIVVQPGKGSTWNAKDLTNRITNRHKLLVDEVTKRYTFMNKRVLDIACNCGYWSALYTRYGANYVVGIEGRKNFYQQAHLYWQHQKFLPEGQYKFIHGDVTAANSWKAIKLAGPFDITLCAGILYHIPDYKRLLTRIAEHTREAIIIDTRVGSKDEKIIDEGRDLCFNAIKRTRKKRIPHLPNLLAHLSQLGFRYELLPVTFKTPSGLRDQDDYNKQRRVTILAQRN